MRMEDQNTINNELIAKAKKAVLEGNPTLARELAVQVLDSDPENISGLLLMAGLSEPQQRRAGGPGADGAAGGKAADADL